MCVATTMAQSKKELLVMIESQTQSINTLNQQFGAITAKQDLSKTQVDGLETKQEQLKAKLDEMAAEQIKNKQLIENLQTQLAELKALVAASNQKQFLNVGWTKKTDFSAGLAVIQDDNTGKHGYIDKAGKIVIPCNWKDARLFDFDDKYIGIAMVQNAEGLWGFIDKAGAEVIPCKWKECRKFGSTFKDLAPVMDEKELWGFIDKSGNVVIPNIYSSIGAYNAETRKTTVKKQDGTEIEIDAAGNANVEKVMPAPEPIAQPEAAEPVATPSI